MATQRKAEVVWQGNLTRGERHDRLRTTSGALPQLPVSWASRSEEPNGKTSPEELIAAAHAACFSMALSLGLAEAGFTAERLETSSTVTFQPGEGITSSALTVRGTVPGISADEFQAAAEDAKAGCPGLAGARRRRDHARRRSSRANLSRRWRRWTHSSRSSSAPTPSCRSGSPTRRSTTTTARRPTVGRRLKELEGPYKLAQAWRQAHDDLDAAQRRRRARGDGPRLRGRGRAARGGASSSRSSSATRPTTRT